MNKKGPKQPNEGKQTVRSASNQSDNRRGQGTSGTSEGRKGQSTSKTSANGRKTHSSTRDGTKGAENNEKINRNRSCQSRPAQNGSRFAQAGKSWALLNELKKLARENPDSLIRNLSNETFLRLLNSQVNNDHIVVIMQIIAQVCSSGSSANRAVLLTMTCTEKKFWESLKMFILTFPFHSSEDRKKCLYWKVERQFWTNLYTYCTTILDVIPTTACDVLRRLLTRVTYTLENLGISEHVKSSFKELQMTLDKYEDETKSRKVIRPVVEPPDNFRRISLYPSCSEITTNEKTFLRKNVTEGSYNSVEHYLDVQFRLLREDFVAPLRKGVTEYLLGGAGGGSNHRNVQNVRVHPKVCFLRHELVNGIRGVKLQFNPSKFVSSRRFMFGALLCFTRDDFKSIIFGKIIDQDQERRGFLVVAFEEDFSDYVFNVDYIMIECKVYFEPYYHVLKALKLMTEENFPMREYLVDVTRRVEYPDYHQNSQKLRIGRLCEADVAAISRPEADKLKLKYPRYKFIQKQNLPRLRIGNWYEADVAANSWPEAEKLKLNNSQYSAFKNALSRKFVVIQGPPGTGKTYVGLLIAKTLIQNSKLWNRHDGPMLVVAYTNHALDQFLEGLLDTTSEIVRIGGRSKNERLEPYNIKCLREDNLLDEPTKGTSREMRVAVEKQIRILKVNYANVVTINKYEGIIDLSPFLRGRPELRGTWFQFANAEDIGNWLLGKKIRRKHPFRPHQVSQKSSALRIDDEKIFDNVNRAEHRFSLDDFKVSASSDVAYIAKVADIEQEIQHMAYTIYLINENIREDSELDIEELRELLWNVMGFRTADEEGVLALDVQLKRDLKQTRTDLGYLEMRMNQGRSADSHVEPLEGDFHSPENIAPDGRWRWYFYWLDEYKEHLNRNLLYLEERYRELYQEYEELRTQEDIKIMKSRLVVGMTTTSAARLQASLQALECPIVIVEEAAEILEAHTVASLTKKCQHLILIGDHQQLRPSTADYNIEKNFFLGISLFERMIMNDVQNNLLDVQHRMRPEIAKLIVPAIYPELKNHESVEGFPMVGGIIPCLYFITHKNQEEVSGDSSKTNLHEAKFLLQLARYLILNGYTPGDVTILAAYSGQMFTLLDVRKSIALLEDVRITTLDNYQGEESKIILLSLVRNNDEGSIGFLAIENRVCVALSRAKEGFYMMGNIDLLASRSQVWQKVHHSLQAQSAVGTSLALRCQNHPSTITQVETADDFQEVPQGGCDEICGQVLECGHSCNVKCHVLDKEHKIQYICREECTRFTCDYKHPCPQLCFQYCGLCVFPVPKLLPCGHEQDVECHLDPKRHKCTVLVLSELPCGHEVNRKCYTKTDTKEFTCPRPCNTKIERCGHLCRSKCHFGIDLNHLEKYMCREKCEKYAAGCTARSNEHLCSLLCGEECRPCNISVEKTRTTCSHVLSVACNVNVDAIPCWKPCEKELPCGHLCKLQCAETCGKCQMIVEKTLPECNHKVTVRCSVVPSRAVCKAKCPRLLPCGHPCSATCREKCSEKCQILIECQVETDCGHKFEIPCYLNNEGLESNDKEWLQNCREPCATKLECGHTCSGTCSECLQGRIHKSCAEKCSNLLICGHECPLPCRQICHPCSLPYTYECTHSRSKKKTCSEPLTPCKCKCPRSCKHVTCTARCGDKCRVPPCVKPCKKTLQCGHPCIGFCNDPCPPLCRVCNKRELAEEIILGFEEDEDARFVLLEECGHVIESRAMERWLQSDGDQITTKRCPTCHTRLTITRRYGDHIKESLAGISEVTRKFYGTLHRKEQMRAELLRKLHDVFRSTRLESVSRNCVTTRLKLQEKLQSHKHTMGLKFSGTLLKMLSSKIQIYQQVCELFHKSKVTRRSLKCISYVNLLLETLIKEENCFTTQEIQDFECELKRLRRLLQLSEIEEGVKDVQTFADPTIKELYKSLLDRLYSTKKYNVEDDSKIKEHLTELAEKVSFESDMSDVELKKIDKIAGAKRGVWYKCPNGHLYAVDDSEEADQMLPTCNECGTNE